ncbi:UvrD-helicase domain-containing protein [Cohnella sp. GCM10012308]|uniref:UvrD-helicase domain-containing protein n=1 Tax=Cohnella sp. GCM10012308 TaxID=3317329 RepID=UPI003620F39A
MLTKEQQAAVHSDAKFILVKAGAGTGKTEVLSQRILRLLNQNQDLSISDMAVITFTNKATENLVGRLKLYLYHSWKANSDIDAKKRLRYELENLNAVQISTIHSFCKSILNDAGPLSFDDFNYSPNFNVSESSSRQALERAFEFFYTNKSNKSEHIYHENIMPYHRFRDIFNKLYHMLRSQGLSISDVVTKTKKEMRIDMGIVKGIKNELVELLVLVVQYHQQLRHQTLDPDNLLEYCYKLLVRSSDAANQIKNKYKYVFVDEFQDTSLYQTGIIKKICDGSPESPSLFVVGDSKQSIYQFRGADLSSYQQVERWIQRDGEILTLSTNFRSTTELVMLVNILFRRIKEANPQYSFQPEPLRPREESTAPVDYTSAYEWLLSIEKEGIKQPELVARYIKENIDKGMSPKDFAILFRKNYQMMDFYAALTAVGIPAQLIGAGSFYNQREVVDTYKILNYILNTTNPVYAEEALETFYVQNDPMRLQMLADALVPIIQKRTPAQLLDRLYQVSNIRERIASTLPQGVANLNKLKALTRKLSISESLQLQEYTGWLHAMIASQKEEQQADVAEGNDIEAVTLITIHKAKGLEYPVVILPRLEESTSQSVLAPPIIYSNQTGLEFSYAPYYGDRNSKIVSTNYNGMIDDFQNELYSEELRVFYVALTRAEKKLVFVGDEHCPKKSICFQNWLRLL